MSSGDLGHAARIEPPQRRRSLRARLVSLSLVWLLFSLLATGGVLLLLFRAETQHQFDEGLRGQILTLAAAARIDEGGRLSLIMEPADPRFHTPLSGWCWELRAGDAMLKSKSLADHDMPPLPGAPKGLEIFDSLPGPGGVRLRVAAQDMAFLPGGRTLSIRVAGPCVTVRDNVLAYMGWAAAALATLGVTLGGLVVGQVVYGLRPLALVQAHLANLRLGHRERVFADEPAEIVPLIEEIDALLDEHDLAVTQARAEAGSLAHALKTPLAVIRNEARGLPGEAGATICAEADRMGRVVEHHLLSARAAAEKRRRNTRASLDQVVGDVRFALERLYPGKRLETCAPPGLHAACAEDDLGEMIGNLADNACKWAATKARISATRTNAMLRVEVADDGPGLDETDRSRVLDQGERLDKRIPGHGLGLSIVAKLASLYGGSLHLRRSDLGGLAAVLEVPESATGDIGIGSRSGTVRRSVASATNFRLL